MPNSNLYYSMHHGHGPTNLRQVFIVPRARTKCGYSNNAFSRFQRILSLFSFSPTFTKYETWVNGG